MSNTTEGLKDDEFNQFYDLNIEFLFYFQLAARGLRNSTQLTFDTLGFLLDRGKVLFDFS